MPCLIGRFDPAIGPIVNVGVLAPGVFSPTGTPPTQVMTFPALIDTGASTTCISPQVAQSTGLRPIGLRPIISATQVLPVEVYLVDLVLPFGPAGLVRQSTQVMQFSAAGGSPFQILLGRDVICAGVLTLSFDGHFSFSL